MAISSQQLWPHVRDAFGISPELQVTKFNLAMAVDNVPEITLEMFGDYDTASGELETISNTFKLGETGVPREQITAARWQGIREGYQAGKDPLWMHAAHLISFDAKEEIQKMVDNFNKRMCTTLSTLNHG